MIARVRDRLGEPLEGPTPMPPKPAAVSPAHDFRSLRLAEFVAWAAQHVTGDEKGQGQIFLDRLFHAFSQKGSLD